MKIAICGRARSGKDYSARWLSQNTSLTFRGSVSWYLAEFVARELQCSPEMAFAKRHDTPETRRTWFEIGRRLVLRDPGFLIRRVLSESDIVCGVRDRDAILWAISTGAVDLVVWIERDVPPDPTLEFDASICDVAIWNNSTLDDLEFKLARLANALNILNLNP